MLISLIYYPLRNMSSYWRYISFNNYFNNGIISIELLEMEELKWILNQIK